MRTTVAISDELLIAAKRRARESGVTLGELIDAALQRELAQPTAGAEALEIPVFRGGTGPRPGVDLRSNRGLQEALDEDAALDHLR